MYKLTLLADGNWRLIWWVVGQPRVTQIASMSNSIPLLGSTECCQDLGVHDPPRHLMQGRRSRCGRCGGRRTNNMLSLASKLLNLTVSSQDCTRNNLRRYKIQNFPGGGPPDSPMRCPLHACSTSWLARCTHHCAAMISSLMQSPLRLTKLKLLPTGLSCVTPRDQRLVVYLQS